MPEIATPIFIVEGDDVAVYNSVWEAEGHLEAPLVAEGKEQGFDAKGQRLLLETTAGLVKISLDSGAGSPETLEAILRRYLVARGERSASEQNCGLPCLVDLARRDAVKTSASRTLGESLKRLVRRVRP